METSVSVKNDGSQKNDKLWVLSLTLDLLYKPQIHKARRTEVCYGSENAAFFCNAMENLPDNFIFKGSPAVPRESAFYFWLTGRFCSSAVVPYKFSLWKQSPSLCPSLSWHQLFISIKFSHCSTSKLVDRSHSYVVTRDKLDESRMMRGAVVVPDRVRQVDTLKLPLLPLPPSL